MSRPPGPGPSAVPPIVWYGVFNEPSGYADEARAYLLALEEAGYAPIANQAFKTILEVPLTPRQRAVVDVALARPTPKGEFVAVHHVVPQRHQRSQRGVPNVVRTMFESDRLPAGFKARLLDVDEVWVPTSFNVETFAHGGIPLDRLRVLPETIDFELYKPGAVEPWPTAPRRSFTFLTNFVFTDRKGWDVLLDAWARAFDADEDVCLLLKCVGIHESPEEVRRRIDEHLAGRVTAPILLDSNFLALAAMPRLYAAADAYVMASRGEGWGRPYMEAMAMGLPTIGSRWSGHLEFMDDSNSWLVDGRLVDIPESAQRHTTWYRGHRWFDPDVDGLAAAMREVFAGGDAVRQRAASARAGLIERFGPGPTAARIAELASDLIERWRARSRLSVSCVWRGDFGSGHSLAVVNDGIVDRLEAGGLTVGRLAPESFPSRLDAVGVAAHWPPSFVAPSLGPFVLYQPWEFGRVPESWVESIRANVDEVWAPSEYVRRAYVDSGVAEQIVHVVPNGVDLERFSPAGPAWPLPTRKGTIFLFVGGTIHRKGIDVLLEAYGRAFGADDDVCLVVKGLGGASFYRGQTAESLFAAFSKRPGHPELVLLDDEVPFDRIPSLYRAADVLVQPYRAEGFCLPALEALACGVPVIVTAGGPTDDFTSEACAWRVPSRRTELGDEAYEGELALGPGGFVLEPDVDALAEALRSAADPGEWAPRAAAARPQAERFGWEAATSSARARLESLSGRLPVRMTKPASVPGRRGFLFLVPADWHDPGTWVPALHAYAEAFSADDDVTLVLPAADVGAAMTLVAGELERAGIDTASLGDIALADPGSLGSTALELEADAAICDDIALAPRARSSCRRMPRALRAAVAGVAVAA